jgi:transcriptional regulator with XRE-family HTH domain
MDVNPNLGKGLARQMAAAERQLAPIRATQEQIDRMMQPGANLQERIARITRPLMEQQRRANAMVTQATRGLRAAHGMSPYVLAEALGMTYPTLNRRLSGKGRGSVWSAEEVQGLALVFNVPVEDLYAGVVRVRDELNAVIYELDEIRRERPEASSPNDDGSSNTCRYERIILAAA